MQKSPFAGITVLDPGEPISSDGFAFTGVDRLIIDRLLALGARLHRHDAHAALGAPSEEPTAELGSVGGFIGAGVTVAVTYTLVDAAGGETLPAPVGSVTTPDGVLSPDESPEITVEDTGGEMLAGTYYYFLTLTDGTGGETEAGPSMTVDIPPGTSTNQVVFVGLSEIVDAYPGAAGWRLYKGRSFGAPHFLASGDALLDTVTDDGLLCADCATQPPTENNTAATNSVDVTVPEHPVNMVPAVAGFRVYVGTEGDFTSPSLLGDFAIEDLGTEVNVSSLQMDPGAPPDIATAIAGANKIDPNTEILDFHWLPPVATHDDLPEGEQGDVRMTLDNGRLWTVLATEAFGPDQWVQVAGGGGSGGGHEIWDEGVLKGPQGIMDFVGAGVTVTEDTGIGKLVVTIPGGGGSGGGGGSSYEGTTVISEQAPWTIPDDDTWEESATVDVEDEAIIGTDTDYPKLFLHITHNYISDLQVELVHPDSTVYQVLPGDAGETGLGTGTDPSERAYFHPYATQDYTNINDDNAVGEWMPSGDWSSMIGKDINGAWQIRVRDIYGGDAGTVQGWGMVFTGGATEQPHSVPLLTTQGLEFREGHANGPVAGKVFMRRKAEYGTAEHFFGDTSWPETDYIVSELGESTLTAAAGGLTPTDTTKKTFQYAGFWDEARDTWWLDDFAMVMRFDILSGHTADWGMVEFGIKDINGHIVGVRVADDEANMSIFEQTGVTRSVRDTGGGHPTTAVPHYLMMERVGSRFYFSLWNTDPFTEDSTPLGQRSYSPGEDYWDYWRPGVSERFRPWISVQPDHIAAITYLERTGFNGGLHMTYYNRMVQGYELWSVVDDTETGYPVARPVNRNLRQVPMETGPAIPKFETTTVTFNSVRFFRDDEWVYFQGKANLAATLTDISPPRGWPKRFWPQQDTTIFLPYTTPVSGRMGECWQISVGGVVTRLSPPTSAVEVVLDQARYLASDYHV